jgi:hypothetical protein
MISATVTTVRDENSDMLFHRLPKRRGPGAIFSLVSSASSMLMHMDFCVWISSIALT